MTQSLISVLIDTHNHELFIEEAIVEQFELAALRMRLMLDDGWPWETFRSELLGFRLAYGDGGAPYQLFKICGLGSNTDCAAPGFLQAARLVQQEHLETNAWHTG